MRLQNLIRIENWLQQELEHLAKTTVSGSSDEAPKEEARKALWEKIQSTVQSVEKVAQDAASTPARLPIQSRRVYEWLVFLSAPENLDAHIETLGVVLEQVGVFASAHQTASLPHLNIEFANRDHLYRVQRSPEAIHLTANEGFVGAPAEILQALVRLAYRRDDSASAARLREYAHSDEFGEVLLALSLSTLDLETNTQGQHYDLRAVFVRVNNQYFGGGVAAPRLVWNRSYTFRKMGHYAANADTIMLSLSLDDARVPNSVVDLIMYHELLHKVMGSQLVNGRRYAHTNAFRQAECRFIGYAEADAWLNEWVKQFRVPE